jgi:hypothetical protein
MLTKMADWVLGKAETAYLMLHGWTRNRDFAGAKGWNAPENGYPYNHRYDLHKSHAVNAQKQASGFKRRQVGGREA